jgi:hypothetical protein
MRFLNSQRLAVGVLKCRMAALLAVPDISHVLNQPLEFLKPDGIGIIPNVINETLYLGQWYLFKAELSPQGYNRGYRG